MSEENEIEVKMMGGRMPAEVLRGIFGNIPGFPGGSGEDTPTADNDSLDRLPLVKQIDALQAACKRYVTAYGLRQFNGCPYEVGTLLSPVPYCALNGRGVPHIVLESRDVTGRAGEPDGADFRICEDHEPTSNSFGSRRDVRVLTISRGTLVAHWVESYELLPFNLPAASAA